MKVYVCKEITLVKTIWFEVEVLEGANIQETVEKAEGDDLHEAESAGRITNLEMPNGAEWAMTDYLVYDRDTDADGEPPDPIATWDVG